MNENKKFNWNDYASIRAPRSVVKQLDEYKQKNGYTSRPQAIISAIERAEKNDMVEEIRTVLNEFLEKGGENLVKKAFIKMGSQP